MKIKKTLCGIVLAATTLLTSCSDCPPVPEKTRLPLTQVTKIVPDLPKKEYPNDVSAVVDYVKTIKEHPRVNSWYYEDTPKLEHYSVSMTIDSLDYKIDLHINKDSSTSITIAYFFEVADGEYGRISVTDIDIDGECEIGFDNMGNTFNSITGIGLYNKELFNVYYNAFLVIVRDAYEKDEN